MRAAPSIEVVVSRFGVWRACLIVLGCASFGSPWWWLLSRAAPASVIHFSWALAASVTAAVSVVSLWFDSGAYALHWNGERWAAAVASDADAGVKAHRSPVRHAGPVFDVARSGLDRFQPGDIRIVIDIGAFLLLTFDRPLIPSTPEPASHFPDVNSQSSTQTSRSTRRRYWLALQKAGLESQWHGLRCALYSRASTDIESSRLLDPSSSA